MRKIIKLGKFRLLPIIIVFLIMPAITFAFVRGQDGYNYYNYNQNTSIGGRVFGGSGFGGGLFCSGSGYMDFCSVVNFILGLIGASIPILVSISVIVFVWGVFRYVIAEGEDKQKSRDVMMYGIIGLFVMVSVWGLVRVVYNTFGLDNNNNSFLYYGGGGSGGGYWWGGSGWGSGSGGGFGGDDTGNPDNSGANSGSTDEIPPDFPEVNIAI